jgi:hypothetical protein
MAVYNLTPRSKFYGRFLESAAGSPPGAVEAVDMRWPPLV